MHADHAAFLRAIRAAPDDDLPRLVYADYLDERGDPRGEFIRLQCELARGDCPPLRARELLRRGAELLDRYDAVWAGLLAEAAYEATFRRGFVEEIEIGAAA